MFSASTLLAVSLFGTLHIVTAAPADERMRTDIKWPTLTESIAREGPTEILKARNSSLFWDPMFAPGLDVESGLKGTADMPDVGCAIVIYYDNLPARHKEAQDPAGPSPVYPLAIAPICSNATEQPQPVDYPTSSSSDSKTIVFGRGLNEPKGDAYLILPYESYSTTISTGSRSNPFRSCSGFQDLPSKPVSKTRVMIPTALPSGLSHGRCSKGVTTWLRSKSSSIFPIRHCLAKPASNPIVSRLASCLIGR